MADASVRPNVLYAVAHDLRHDLSSNALRGIATDRGCRFGLAFAPAPYCAASRNSFFTGRRTTVTGVHTCDKRDARDFAPLMRRRRAAPDVPLWPRP